MTGDITRPTSWPSAIRLGLLKPKRYDSVRMQQGRLQLDPDWNEQMDIQAHLREAALRDVIGGCCAPDGEPGFGIGVLGGDLGDLTISTGRLYVDGILCEQTDDDLTYLTQEEDLPGAPVPAAGTQLVYLDVWKWHVTALEDPEIREVALGGPDTATRLKTVCQVKLLRVGDLGTAVTCGDQLGAWDKLTAPTSARLAARTRPVVDPDDPCVVPATAGYTRLEHQLYRVEIHEEGELGTATFKWSRDNGTVVTDWLEQDGNALRVRSTGRDRLLGFHDAHWVELTDDGRELRGEPGLLVEVVSIDGDIIEIDPGAQTVDLATFGAHPKVRRWDMDTGGGAVTVEVPADNDGWIGLEGGIEIKFEAGDYSTGDYWLIPARAFVGEFAGDIEWPREAVSGDPLALPPHGIEHHYCRLALVDFDGQKFAGVSGGDCRDTFPSLCGLEAGAGCCTVVVAPGESIQDAIDALPAEGGCVCLKAGTHEIEAPLSIARSNVSMHGESPGVHVVRRNGVPLLEVRDASGLTVEDVEIRRIQFALEQYEPTDVQTPLVRLSGCERLSLIECGVACGAFAQAPGVHIHDLRDVCIERCTIERVWIGLWVTGDTTAVTIRDNSIAASSGESPEDDFKVGIHLEEAIDASRIEGNDVSGFLIGISLNSNAVGSVITGNRVTRQAIESGLFAEKVYGIDVDAGSCVLRDNTLTYRSADYGGIRVTGPSARIEANRLESSAPTEDHASLPLGILLGRPEQGSALGGDQSVINGNRLSGAQDAIWVAGSRGVAVLDNYIGDVGDGVRFAVAVSGSSEARIQGNRITGSSMGIWVEGGEDHQINENHLTDGGAGITLNGFAMPVIGATVAGNRVERMESWGLLAANLFFRTTNVIGNRFTSCGHNPGETAFGVGLLLSDADVLVESCEILDTGVSVGSRMVQPAYGLIGVLLRSCRIEGNRIATYPPERGFDPAGEDRAAVLWGLDLEITDQLVLGGSAQVLGNQFIGPGASHLVEFLQAEFGGGRPSFLRFERVAFSDNYCWHWSNLPRPGLATVSLRGRSALVIGNHIKADTALSSVDFNNMKGVFIGNDTQATLNAGSVIPGPAGDFNL